MFMGSVSFWSVATIASAFQLLSNANADVEAHPRAWAYRWWRDRTWVPARDDGQSITDRGPATPGGGAAMAFLREMIAVPEWQNLSFGVIQNASPNPLPASTSVGTPASRSR